MAAVPETAFGDRLAAEVPGLLRFARTLVRDGAAAEDLVQETLARALERQGAFRGEASLATWLHRILHNLAVDRWRAAREVPAEDVGEAVERQWRDDAWTVDAAAVVTAAETRAELEDALVHLPVAYRAAVVLHDAEGLTVAQIADLQQVSLAAAKQRLRRGRMMLVSRLAEGRARRAALRGVPLRCWDARAHVSDYLDGELDAPTSARLEQHLAGCPTCPPLYAGLVATRDALRAAPSSLRDPDTVVPQALLDRLRAHASGTPEPGRP